MSLIVEPLSPVLGVSIRGLDLSRPLDDAAFAEVETLCNRHSVVAFRDQRISPEQHIAFSRRFGALEIHVQQRFHLAGHPEILKVSNVIENGQPLGLADAGHYWHSDLSYLAKPSLGSLLHAQEIPTDDGDTLFVNMAAAYRGLSPELQERLTQLYAVHDYQARNLKQASNSALRPILSAEQAARVPPVTHPVVRVHPATGERSLFVSEGFTTRIVGLDAAQSDTLLEELFAHSVRPEFQYRHRWQPHDLLFWDNRATMHFATGCAADKRRTLYRTTICGSTPIAVAGNAAFAASA